jgi:hypothetical protein
MAAQGKESFSVGTLSLAKLDPGLETIYDKIPSRVGFLSLRFHPFPKRCGLEEYGAMDVVRNIGQKDSSV